MKPTNRQIDPITLEVVRGGLVSLCTEMGIAMERSAYSPVFSEGLDYSYALFDGIGEMIAQAAFDPCHLGAMPYSVKSMIDEIGLGNIQEGDILLNNDPYSGGSHLSDFTAALPIFYKGEIVAMPAARAHQIDVGAVVAGGFAGDASELFHEGLRIPPIKVIAGGNEVKDVWKLILANVRLPHAVEGDMRAMFGALKIGQKRINQYLEKYGATTWKNSLNEIKDISETIMRREINQITPGTYEYEDYIDDSGRSSSPAKIHVKIEVKDDELIADYSGSSPQVPGPINAAFAVTAGNTVIGILHSVEISGDYILNQGTFRPIRVIAPKGTIVNPAYPAPVQGGNTELSNRIVDTVIGALTQATTTNRIKASCHGTDSGMTVGGLNQNNEPYIIYLWSLGGQGARAAGDGNSAMLPFATNNKGPFVEINEVRYPILFEEYSLSKDSAGAGKFRGGIGTRLVWRLRTKECELSCLSERHRISPYGVFGGLPPMPRDCGHFSDTRLKINGHEYCHATDLFNKLSPSKWASITIHEGDSVEMILSGGGGWGRPYDRDPDDVAADVQQGLVSIEFADSLYGVIIDPQTLKVDTSATNKIRENRKSTGFRFELDPRIKILHTELAETKQTTFPAQLTAREGVECVFKHPKGFVVKIEAANCDQLTSRLEQLRKALNTSDIRPITTQFVPSNFRSPN